jgi:hypothetical protein
MARCPCRRSCEEGSTIRYKMDVVVMAFGRTISGLGGSQVINWYLTWRQKVLPLEAQ